MLLVDFNFFEYLKFIISLDFSLFFENILQTSIENDGNFKILILSEKIISFKILQFFLPFINGSLSPRKSDYSKEVSM